MATLESGGNTMPERTKIRHHFVPAFYLRGFSDSKHGNLLWVYSKTSDEMFCQKPENVGFEKHYHTFGKLDGTKDTNTIEDYFCHVWEGPAANIIESIKAGSFPVDKDRQFFASFLGLSFTRSPNHRENFERIIVHLGMKVAQFSAADPEYFAQTLQNYERDMGEKLTEDPEGLRKLMLNGGYDLSVRPELYLKMFIGHGLQFGLVIEKMKWNFIQATSRFKFLTSDNPFFLYDPSVDNRSFLQGTGLLNKTVEISFPISQDLALIATWNDHMTEGYLQGSHELVKTVNRRSALAAHRFVYASEKSVALSRLVQKCAKSRPSVKFG
jgi:hypothetical protein